MIGIRGLFLGRFQPFHIGHLNGVQRILRECTSVLIVISSSHECHTLDNPFSGGERYEMIKRTMLELDIAPERYDIIPIGFYDSTPSFVAATISSSPAFQRVYSGNPQVISLFSSWHYEVRPIHSDKTSGTEVRRKIVMNETWEPFVPSPVADFLHTINGLQRIKLLDQSASREGLISATVPQSIRGLPFKPQP